MVIAAGLSCTEAESLTSNFVEVSGQNLQSSQTQCCGFGSRSGSVAAWISIILVLDPHPHQLQIKIRIRIQYKSGPGSYSDPHESDKLDPEPDLHQYAAKIYQQEDFRPTQYSGLGSVDGRFSDQLCIFIFMSYIHAVHVHSVCE